MAQTRKDGRTDGFGVPAWLTWLLGRLPVAVVMLLALALIAVGWAQAYSNGVDVMSWPVVGFAPHAIWKAQTWPVVGDVAGFAVILALATGMVRKGWPTIACWVIFAASATVMLVVNGMSGGTVPWTNPPSPTFVGVAFAHSWPSLLGMAVLFVAIHGRAKAAPPDPEERSRPAPDEEEERGGAELSERGAHQPAPDEEAAPAEPLQERMKALLATPAGRSMNGAQLGGHFEISQSYARKVRAAVLAVEPAPPAPNGHQERSDG